MAYLGQGAEGNFTTTNAKDTFSGNGSTTTFTLSQRGTENNVDVFVNNVRQEPNVAYNIEGNGTSLVFTAAPSSGTNNIYVVNRGPAELSATHPSGQALEATNGTFTGDLTVDTNTLVVDSTNNRVAIGRTSPSRQLHISGSGANTRLRVENTTGSNVLDVYAEDGGNSTLNYSSVLTMSESGTERMRIDDSGNLLVGHTGSIFNNINSTSTVGTSYSANGEIFACSSQSSGVMILNRKSTDGAIATFRKDGTSVGSIGTSFDLLYMASTSGAGFRLVNDDLRPATTSGGNRDNALDLGHSSVRWDDVYATNGTIQTSDQNEKQQIASLTDAEITAAKAISTLFKTFKWNDSVEENGDSARTHTGVIAQDVQQAMTDAGLDAGDYAFFISTTWWETQTDVPAVEADEENGIEAADAYTRTDTYDTAEEAPEGATERTRLGIRYPELLAFVGAATEQRLADIETRIAALEAE